MTSHIQSDIRLIIKELENYNSRSAELAHNQLELLLNTGAGKEAYESFYDDLKGALAVFK